MNSTFDKVFNLIRVPRGIMIGNNYMLPSSVRKVIYQIGDTSVFVQGSEVMMRVLREWTDGYLEPFSISDARFSVYKIIRELQTNA